MVTEAFQIRDALPGDCDAMGLITVSASHSAFVGAIPEEAIDFSWTPSASAAGWRDSFSANTDRGQRIRVVEADGRVVRDAARQLERAGARSVIISCVKENPSCGFYRRLGGQEIGRRPVRVDAFSSEEILFGWPDISLLT